MNLLKYQYLLVLSFMFQSISLAQNWTSYESEQKINDLVETSTELFMATDAGLVVMNKTTLSKSIYNINNSSLPSNHIQTITEASNGDIWIGTYDVKLARFNGSDFVDIISNFDPSITLTSNLFDIEIASNGDFWLGTSDGVLLKQGTAWTFFDETELGPNFFKIWDIEINAAGEVFAGGFELLKFSNGVWSNTFLGTTLEGYLDAEVYIASNGTLYFAGDLSRLATYNGTAWTEYNVGFTINNFEAGMFTEDLSGNVYFNTKYNGILKFNGTNWVQETSGQITANGIKSNFYYIDNSGDKWLNRNIHLSVDRGSAIENTLISDASIESNAIKQLRLGNNGNVYFITGSNENFSALNTDDDTWSFLAKPNNSFEFYNDILALAENDIWVASSAGLYHYESGNWTSFALDACKSFARDSQGKIYVRSDFKIYTIENNVIGEINPTNSPGLTSFYILGHGIDADDNLWIAAGENGGFAIDNLIQKRNTDGTWTTYLEADYPILARPIGDFVFDNEGNVWVSIDAIGVIKFDGTTFTNPIQENLSLITNYNALSISKDTEGSLYFAHQYGVTKLKNGEWQNLIISNVPNTNSSTTASITIDDEGTLWWGSSKHGVFSYKQDLSNGILKSDDNKINFSVFPNPVNNKNVSIQVALEKQAETYVKVYSELGQLLLHNDLGNLAPGNYQKTIDVSALPKGLYFLKLQTGNQTNTKIIVVN